MSCRRHPAGPVTVQRLGADPEIVPASEFRRDAVSAIVDVDPPRLLARGPVRRRRDDGEDPADLGYTSTPALALHDAPEAVRKDLQDAITTKVGKDEKEKKAAAAVAHAARARRLLADLEEWRNALREDHLFTHETRRDYTDARRGLVRLLAQFDPSP